MRQPDQDGWIQVSIPIEETNWTASLFTRIGADLEVLSPPELREAMADVARRMAALYAVIGFAQWWHRT